MQKKKLKIHWFKYANLYKKKCEFLARVKKKLMLSVSIINERVEKVEEKYDVILSRAVAPLNNLLRLLMPISKKNTIFLDRLLYRDIIVIRPPRPGLLYTDSNTSL